MRHAKRFRGAEAAPGQSPQVPATPPAWQHRAAGVVILVAVALVYANGLLTPFHFDDKLVTENPAIDKLWQPWLIYLTRPVLGFSLALNYRLSAFDTWSYHALNILIHALAGLTLFGILRRSFLTEKLRGSYGTHATGLAFAAAMIWAVHPLQTQAVTYIYQRGESLMGLFYLLALYCAIRARHSPRAHSWWAAVGVCGLAGLGTKQVMVTMPVVVLAYYWTFFPEDLRKLPKPLWWIAAAAALTWLGALGYLASRSVSATAGLGVEDATPWTYALTQTKVVLYYLRLALWPGNLAIDYGWPVAKSLVEVWYFAVGLTGLLGLTAWGVFQRRAPALAGLCFFVILAPTSSFLPIADVLVEHRMYLPLAGVVVLVTVGVWRGVRGRQTVAWSMLALVLLGLSGTTIARNRLYASDLELWGDAAAKYPLNPRSHNNLGLALAREGRYDEAIQRYEAALRLNGDYSHAHGNLANALLKRGRNDEAIEHCRVAARLENNSAESLNNLGGALMIVGKPGEALPFLQQAIAKNPGLPESRYNLGLCLNHLGRTAEAAEAFRAADYLRPGYTAARGAPATTLASEGGRERRGEPFEQAERMRPDEAVGELRRAITESGDRRPDLYARLGLVLQRLNRYAEALPEFQNALRLQPDLPDALGGLANCYTALNRLEDAVPQLQAYLRLKPGDAEAHNNLGTLFARLNRIPEALSHYERAVQLAPGSAPARSNLANAHLRLGRAALQDNNPDLMRKHFTKAVELDPGLSKRLERGGEGVSPPPRSR